MAKEIKRTKTIIIQAKQGTFSAIFSRFRGENADENSDIALVRSILTNEKAKILHVIKTKQPNSLYELAKLLARDFKSVRQDILLLEKAGLVEMIPIHKGKREKLKPLLVVDSLEVKINI